MQVINYECESCGAKFSVDAEEDQSMVSCPMMGCHGEMCIERDSTDGEFGDECGV